MSRRLLLSAILLLACAAFGGDGDVRFPGGTCRRMDGGEFELAFPKGSLHVAARNVLKKWRFVPVDDVVASVRVNDGKLELDFEAVNRELTEVQQTIDRTMEEWESAAWALNDLLRRIETETAPEA